MKTEFIVVGGGLAGLTAALTVAKAGRKVVVFEQAGKLGGRGATDPVHGFSFNLGPHALYRAGAAARIFAELNIQYTGGVPQYGGAKMLHDGRLYDYPYNPATLASSRLLTFRSKIEVGRFLAKLPSLDTTSVAGLTVAEFLKRQFRTEPARRLVAASLRTATYSADYDLIDLQTAINQLKLVVAGRVMYVDGGWSALASSLRDSILNSGGSIFSDRRAVEVIHDGDFKAIRLDDGTVVEGDSAILAVSPDKVRAMLKRPAPQLSNLTPIRAACLDIGLAHLPQQDPWFVIGFEEPLYLSVHSRWAKLAPDGGAVIQVLRYLRAGENIDSHTLETQLEGLLDHAQPGWRSHVVARRFFPTLTVSHMLIQPASSGAPTRPRPAALEIDGLYIAGDWVGTEGMLVDAAVASATSAAELAIESTERLRHEFSRHV